MYEMYSELTIEEARANYGKVPSSEREQVKHCQSEQERRDARLQQEELARVGLKNRREQKV